MKHTARLLAGIAAALVIAALAYSLASAMIDSFYTYRSPLHDAPPAPGEALGSPATRRLVFVLVDALRTDTAFNPQVMPTLAHLREQGASATMHSRPPSFSQPGYSTLLTGAWPEINDGPVFNVDREDIPTWTQDNLFSAVRRSGQKTALSGFDWFERLVPQEDVTTHFYTPGEDAAADRTVVDAALPWLDDPSYSFVLIHIDQVDYTGHHDGGPQSPNWNAAASRADDLIAEITAKLDFSIDTLLVASDHGQINRGGHGGQDPVTLLEPFILAGAGVKPGDYSDIQMVDLAPTVAALLGTNLPASTQGHVRTEMLNLPPDTLTALPGAEVRQQNALYQAYSQAIGSQSRSVLAAGIDANFDQLAARIENARTERLRSDRLPRFLLAILFLLITGAILLRIKGQISGLWLLTAGLLTLALFHLGYGVLEGRTYSFSSVDSPTGLVLGVALPAVIAMIAGWLIAVWKGKLLQGRRMAAAQGTLTFLWVTLWLLSLPVLFHSAMNGLLITWTLPEFTSQFLALLSLIQMLIIALVGLLLAGTAALLARRSAA